MDSVACNLDMPKVDNIQSLVATHRYWDDRSFEGLLKQFFLGLLNLCLHAKDLRLTVHWSRETEMSTDQYLIKGNIASYCSSLVLRVIVSASYDA